MTPFSIGTSTGMIGPGQHEVTVDHVDEGTSSGGHPQLIIDFKNKAGATIRDWLVVIDSTTWKVKQLWDACGLEFPDDGGEINERDLIDKRLMIKVEPQEYNGTSRDRVTEYYTVVGSDIPIDEFPTPEKAPAKSPDDEPIPFFWRPVERVVQETSHNPFA